MKETTEKKSQVSILDACLSHTHCVEPWWFDFVDSRGTNTQKSSKNMRLNIYIYQLYFTNHANYLNHLN